MSSPPADRHVVITGLMGVGKSTTANALSARLGCPWRDSDRDIRRLFATTGAELAAQKGVPELHRVEAAVLLGALAGPAPTIIAAAASVVDDVLCQQALKRRAYVVVLHAPIDDLIERLGAAGHRRAMDRSEFADLADRRAPLFAQVADLALDTTMGSRRLVERIANGFSSFARPAEEAPPNEE